MCMNENLHSAKHIVIYFGFYNIRTVFYTTGKCLVSYRFMYVSKDKIKLCYKKYFINILNIV